VIIGRKLKPKVLSDTAQVGVLLEGIWSEIRARKLYSGQPRARQSIEAAALAKMAVKLAARTEMGGHAAQACRMMALTLNANEQYSAAIRYYRRALSGLDALGNAEQAARTRLGFIAALGILGRYQEADDEAKSAHEWFQKNGDSHGQARLLTNIGNIHLRRENYQDALECHSRAHELFALAGDENALAISSLNVANCFMHLNAFDRADEMYGQAETLSRKLELPDLNKQVRYNRTYLVLLRGRTDDALRGLETLKREFRQQKSSRYVALCDLDLALIYLRKNAPAAAFRHAKKSERVFGTMRMRYERAKALLFAGVALAQARRFKKSLAALHAAQVLFKAEGNLYWMALIDICQASIVASLKQTQRADALLNRARLMLEHIHTQEKKLTAIRTVLASCAPTLGDILRLVE
jgi:tetratricopeptide (TPR) repeat protein